MAAAALAMVLTACGGGGNNNANAGASPAATSTNNAMTTGSHAKQLNPLHKLHNAMSGSVININMGAMSGSKQDGSASIGKSGNGVQVTVSLFNEPKGASEPAHIHKGTCTKLDPAPYKPLTNVVGGKSVTTIPGLTMDDLKKGTFAINVHKSLSDLKTYVSCGNLK